MTDKPIKFSIISLIIACLALILATVPTQIIESKINQLKHVKSESKSPAATIELKGVKFSISNKTEKPELFDNLKQIEKLNQYLLTSKVAMIISSIFAIFLSLYAWKNEENKPLSIGSIVISCVAISWQYVAVGISTGVGIFILIMLLMTFGI